MKNPPPHPHTSKLIASHALVIAIFTSPYFILVWGDIYNVAKIGLTAVGVVKSTTYAAPIVMDHTQRMSLSFLSVTAAIVSVVAFTIYLLERRN